jgi:hypothetical protein
MTNRSWFLYSGYLNHKARTLAGKGLGGCIAKGRVCPRSTLQILPIQREDEPVRSGQRLVTAWAKDKLAAEQDAQPGPANSSLDFATGKWSRVAWPAVARAPPGG